MKSTVARSKISQYVPPLERFWLRVDKNGPKPAHLEESCWVWTGGGHSSYGYFMVNAVYIRVHVYSYQIHHGPTGDMKVCHKCDNRLCVNPSHLFLGTHSDNRQDCVDKNRHAKGEAIATSKLTPEIVREMRRRYVPRCFVNGSSALAREFGVTQAVAYEIIKRKAWKHID